MNVKLLTAMRWDYKHSYTHFECDGLRIKSLLTPVSAKKKSESGIPWNILKPPHPQISMLIMLMARLSFPKRTFFSQALTLSQRLFQTMLKSGGAGVGLLQIIVC